MRDGIAVACIIEPIVQMLPAEVVMAPEITTRTERIWLGEDGIVRVIMLPVARQTLADAEENVRVIGSLVPSGRRPPLLVDSRQLKSMTREARAYYASA